MALATIMKFLPEVKAPIEKKLGLKTKLKWTLIVLVLYFVLGFIPLFGLGDNALQRFEFLSVVLGAKFGSLISLGIGPIVTASIILQLLVGAGILNYDLSKSEDRKRFEALQKITTIFFILFEAFLYVYMGGLSPAPYFDPQTNSFVSTQSEGMIALTSSQINALRLLLVFQLTIGGFIILLLDEVVSKWGIGSGISLFIAAGVSQQIFVGAFSWVKSTYGGAEYPVGTIPALFVALRNSDPLTALTNIAKLFFTILVFLLAVYAQAMKVEIPLSYGKVRGYGIKWPLRFIYTSNIPVILTAALFGNLQIFARLLENATANSTNKFLEFLSVYVLGQTNTVKAGHGIVQWISGQNLIQNLITGSFSLSLLGQALIYVLLMVLFSILFGVIWVQTSGMDPKSVAKQISGSGLQIPGFRSDIRILERLLKRYIWPLSVMGAGFVGLLAAVADLTGALSRGTGILLTVMIVYRFYETIAKEHALDLSPNLRKFIKT